MNKLTLIALFITFNACFGSIFLNKEQNKLQVGAFAQLQQIETTSFGKNLLDTIALQIKNKQPIAEISKLLGELRADLVNQQIADDAQQVKDEAECEANINTFNQNIEDATTGIEEATKAIKDAKIRIGELEASTAQYRVEIGELEDLIDARTNERAKRAAQFDARVEHHEQVIDAFDLILSRLDEIEAQTTDVEESLLQLSKIGKANPIAALVQVSASLSPEQLDNVKGAIRDLKDATAASLVEDRGEELNEIANFQEFIRVSNESLEQLRFNLKRDEELLAEQRGLLADAEIKLEFNENKLEANTRDLEAETTRCENDRIKYENDKAKRNEEIDIVDQVIEIFANRISVAQDYILERVDQ